MSLLFKSSTFHLEIEPSTGIVALIAIAGIISHAALAIKFGCIDIILIQPFLRVDALQYLLLIPPIADLFEIFHFVLFYPSTHLKYCQIDFSFDLSHRSFEFMCTFPLNFRHLLLCYLVWD